MSRLLEAYLKRGIVPIINENDVVNKEELEHRGHFTDNDILAALVAERLHVDQALLLTNVDGLMHRRSDGNGGNSDTLVRTVETVNDDVKALAWGGPSAVGLGGMYSKVVAAERMTARGIEVIVGNGRLPLATLLHDPVPAYAVPAAGSRARRRAGPPRARPCCCTLELERADPYTAVQPNRHLPTVPAH